jgi:hypothetical protein
MEYYERYGDAIARLSWSSASQPLGVIPNSQLYDEISTTSSRQDISESVTEIVLRQAGETVDIAGLSHSMLTNIKTVDIRGNGDNQLILDASTIAAVTPDRTLTAIADHGDDVHFDDGWHFSHVEVMDGRFHRIFHNGSASLRLVGPTDWTNPLDPIDVNANGDGTALDALEIIDALSSRRFSTPNDVLIDATTVDPKRFRFCDVNNDGMLTAVDALYVINRLSRLELVSNDERTFELDETGDFACAPYQPGSEALAQGIGPVATKIQSIAVGDNSLTVGAELDTSEAAKQNPGTTMDDLDHALANTLEWLA